MSDSLTPFSNKRKHQLFLRISLMTCFFLSNFQNTSAAAFNHVLFSRSDLKRGHSSFCFGKRGDVEEVNELLRGMGLKPVDRSSFPTKKPSRPSKKFNKKNNLSSIPLKNQLDFARNGHIVLHFFLSPQLVIKLRSELLPHAHNNILTALNQKISVITSQPSNRSTISQCQETLQSLSIPLPFLQLFNTWRVLPTIQQFVTSPQMAYTAAQLLDVPSVKLYQDSLFWKRQTDTPTPWHSDARMAPFDTSNMITFWIPLQDVHHTGLRFVDKSHSDFALPYWNDVLTSPEYSRLEERYSSSAGGGETHHMPLKMGDVTVHSGWTLHCANGGNESEGEDRYALAVTYVDAKAEVREDVFSELGDDEDRMSYAEWVGDVEPRCYFEHDLVPIVWPPCDEIL